MGPNNYGDHLQYSVFKCQLTAIDLAKCRHELSEIIKHDEDQVLFVDLSQPKVEAIA